MLGLLHVLAAPAAGQEPGWLRDVRPHVEDQGSFRNGEKVAESC